MHLISLSRRPASCKIFADEDRRGPRYRVRPPDAATNAGPFGAPMRAVDINLPVIVAIGGSWAERIQALSTCVCII